MSMKIKFFALLSAAAIAFAACGDTDITARAAATVNGQKITVDQVDNELAKFEKSGQFEQLTAEQSANEVRRQFQQGYLSQIVRRHIMRPLAEERGLEVTDDEVKESIEAIKADFPSEKEFEDALDQQGVSSDQLPELVRDQLTEEALREDAISEIEPNDDDLQSFYDENIDRYRQTEASHILLEDRKQADDVASMLQKAKANEIDKLFAEQAKKLSKDPGSGEKGGELGYFASGELVPEFEEAAGKLELGEVSDPVQSEFGFHIIRVTDRRLQPFEDVRDTIAQELSGAEAEEAFQDLVVKAYKEADVRVNPRYGELDLETQRIVDADADDIPGGEEPAETPPAEGEEAPATPPATDQ
jgi:parvulin-like peptidyl-prolyl isomerase